MNQPQQPLALSINQTVQLSGIGRTRIYAAIRSGSLICRKYGKRTLILRKDLEDFLANLPPGGN